MVNYTVELTRKASHDLDTLLDYIEEHDSTDRAKYVFDPIISEINGLREYPELGVVPIEIRHTARKEIREIFFKPYRIFYHIEGKRARVFLIADGRRNMQEVLARRLIQSGTR